MGTPRILTCIFMSGVRNVFKIVDEAGVVLAVAITEYLSKELRRPVAIVYRGVASMRMYPPQFDGAMWIETIRRWLPKMTKYLSRKFIRGAFQRVFTATYSSIAV